MRQVSGQSPASAGGAGWVEVSKLTKISSKRFQHQAGC